MVASVRMSTQVDDCFRLSTQRNTEVHLMKPVLALALIAILTTSHPVHAQDNPFIARVQAAGLPDAAAGCLELLATQAPDTPAQVERMDHALVCYRGAIDQEGVSSLLDTLEGLEEGSPLTVMMRSNGGDVAPALDAAESLERFEVTFVAAVICASSCANYLFQPATQRIVLADSIVAFKGGMSPDFGKTLERQLDDERKKRNPDQERVGWMARTVADLPAVTARQNALLERSGIRPTFFNAFDDLNARPRRSWSQDCARQRKASMLVLSEEVLADQGANIALNLGPTSASELVTLLDQVGAAGSACWWDLPWPAGKD